MNKIEQLKRKLKWLKVLLAIVPFIYVFVIGVIKKTSKKVRTTIIIVTAGFIIFCALLGYEYFETKRELQELQSIQLIIGPARSE